MGTNEDHPIPECYRILKEHNVTVFAGSILGSTLGTLCDAGLNDLEILTVCSEFLRIIRTTAGDPKMLENLAASQEMIKRVAESGQ